MLNKYEIIEVKNGFLLRVMKQEYSQDTVHNDIDEVLAELKKLYPTGLKLV